MEELRTPPPLLLLSLLLLSFISSGRAATASAFSPTPAPVSAPSRGRPSSTSSSLDPKQLSALQSMGLPTAGGDLCANPSPRDNATSCDTAVPFRHLLSLRLANCSPDLDLSPTALHALSTLRFLSFLDCPVPPPKRFPPNLASSLLSFSCVSSLRRLSGVWLSHFRNLTDLTVVDVPVATSGIWVIESQTPNLRSLTLSHANLSGSLPHHWHALGVTHLDLSGNAIEGPIPVSIGQLGSLQTLNLSFNSLSGVLPDGIGDLSGLKIASLSHNSLSGPIPEALSELSDLVHLDLSSNQFNGSVPRFLSAMTALRHLNLENNNLQGVVPFNETFVKRMQVLKLGGNANLCYNHTQLKSKVGLGGVAPCDKHGLPMSPPPDRSSSSDYSLDDGGDDDGGGDKKGGGGHHEPSKLVLGVAIALSCLVFLVIFCVCISKVCR